MKKILKRLIIGTSGAFLTLTALLAAFILYPNSLFAERVTYREFNLYSKTKLSGNYRVILHSAVELVKTSELYDSDYRYDILLADETVYKTISSKLLGPALARSIDNNITLNIPADFDRNLLRAAGNKRDLTRTIAHEMIHCLQTHRYGILKFNPLHHPPLWKLEGYPEYIAYQDEIAAPGYRFSETVEKLLELEADNARRVELKSGHFDPLIYFKGRVLIEYLMDIKGMTYNQILTDRRPIDSVQAELGRFYSGVRGID